MNKELIDSAIKLLAYDTKGTNLIREYVGYCNRVSNASSRTRGKRLLRRIKNLLVPAQMYTTISTMIDTSINSGNPVSYLCGDESTQLLIDPVSPTDAFVVYQFNSDVMWSSAEEQLSMASVFTFSTSDLFNGSLNKDLMSMAKVASAKRGFIGTVPTDNRVGP